MPSATATYQPCRRGWTHAPTREERADHDFADLLTELQAAILLGEADLARHLFAEIVAAYRRARKGEF